MNLLLDTHVLLWWDEGRRISAEARQAIEEADTVYVSAASAWEIAIKTGLGRLRPTRTVDEAVRESGFLELPITFLHAQRLTALPTHHRDPFDRLLVAQAEVEELTLVTRDPVFAGYQLPVIVA
ncbi:MAG TPA: type II toxin-antitoxin system VapC family toxin [Gemmatimonadales bacterium]|nr:type II toxin-antitoxin system VapC family toxin [Gemmatimonadales bacterium]